MTAGSSLPFVPSAVDFAALVVIVFDAYFGFRRGLSGESARIVVLLLGVAATAFLLHPMGTLCFRYASPAIPEAGRYAFAFVATTLAASVAVLIAHRPIHNWLDHDAPRHRNKFGGLVAGLTHGVVGVMFVLIVLNLWPNARVAHLVGSDSIAGQTANKVVPLVKQRLGSRGWAAAEPKADGKSFFKMLREEKRDHTAISK